METYSIFLAMILAPEGVTFGKGTSPKGSKTSLFLLPRSPFDSLVRELLEENDESRDGLCPSSRDDPRDKELRLESEEPRDDENPREDPLRDELLDEEFLDDPRDEELRLESDESVSPLPFIIENASSCDFPTRVS